MVVIMLTEVRFMIPDMNVARRQTEYIYPRLNQYEARGLRGTPQIGSACAYIPILSTGRGDALE
jgi:hypothetical protein